MRVNKNKKKIDRYPTQFQHPSNTPILLFLSDYKSKQNKKTEK